MSGVEFLGKAMEIYPDAKRALLTAYADTEAAIQAINTAKINYYLTKPWDPPEERLYPVLNDLLETWKEGYRPPFEGLRVLGPRYTLRDHQVRDFLSRNRVPYVWLDPEQNAEGVDLLTRFKLDDHKLPVVLFGDGSYLVQPGQMELASKIGLRTQAERDFYDLAIIGAGPAGLAAAVYGASEGLRTLVIDNGTPGGQAGSSSRIENYLGFPLGRGTRHGDGALGERVEAVALEVVGGNDRLLAADNDAQAEIVAFGALRLLDRAVAHLD
jgi:thioredoxin reductase (NADPH)